MNYGVDQDVPLATGMANQINEVDYHIYVNPLARAKWRLASQLGS